MSQDTVTPSTDDEDQYSNLDYATDQVCESTPYTIIEQIARQMDRADEASKRIKEEGIVVRDMKGSVIQHPAIKIELDACKVIADLLKKHKKE